MKKMKIAALVLMSLLLTAGALAEDTARDAAQPAEEVPPVEETAAEAQAEPDAEDALPEGVVTEYRWFVGSNKVVRTRKVTYYDNVYAYNHGNWGLTPFDSTVPAEYFVLDEDGSYALAPIVLDITDAMRTALYGSDIGETALYYGQYCDRIRGNGGKVGFSGVHEGIDFICEPGAALHAIIGGEVTRAGDSNGTIGIYNAELDVTVLYLHCEDIAVRRGDVVEAGTPIAVEGNTNSGTDYTHVELRAGRHTSSNTYRDTKLESDCPYPYMEKALNVVSSGRQPQTAAAVAKAQRMREEAEAAARAEAEAAEAAAKAEEEQQNAEPEIELVDVLPGTKEGYGFGTQTEELETESTPAATAVPEATLPPSKP